jgi:cytochrome c oxidase cbb3-type subunit 4
MELYSTLSSIFTVVSFLVFLGIVGWAWSARRSAAFAAAAAEPFALPDDAVAVSPSRAGRRELAERAPRAVADGAPQ